MLESFILTCLGYGVILSLFRNVYNSALFKPHVEWLATPASCSGGPAFRSRHGHYSDWCFCGFSQSVKGNAGLVPHITLWMLPSISFPIHYSLIVRLNAIRLHSSLSSIYVFYKKIPRQSSVCIPCLSTLTTCSTYCSIWNFTIVMLYFSILIHNFVTWYVYTKGAGIA